MNRLAAVGAATLVACSGGPKELGNRFPGPAGAVRFAGIAAQRPGALRFYVAVASARGDELRLIDPEDGTIVPGPGGIFPLAIPTMVQRPARIVSTPLEISANPHADRRAGSDLVVVVGEGSLQLEVLNTWSGQLRIERTASIDLALDPAIGSGASLSALAAGPVPGVDGRARVFAALSEGRLAVVEFERNAGGAIEHRTTTVKALAFGTTPAFDVRDIAVEPDGDRIFCATGDPIGEKPDPAAPGGPPLPIFGVAQIKVPADASAAWIHTPLDALAPTQLVAATRVFERTVASTKVYEKTALLEVFASLDPSGCGTRSAIDCGIATLYADSGLAPDPTVDAGWKMPYRAPIPVPGLVITMTVLTPPAGSTKEPPVVPLLYGASFDNATTAALAVVTSTGRLHFIDLARWALASNKSYVSGDGRARIADAGSLYQTDKDSGKPLPALTLLDAKGIPIDPTQDTATSLLAQNVRFTPGYTYGDRWTLSYRGALPAYFGLLGAVGRDAVGPWLAFQVPSGLVPTPGPGFWKVVRAIGPAELGLRVGDLVDVVSSLEDCVKQTGDIPVENGFRTTVTAILAPDPALWPGGAIRLADLGCMESGVPAASSVGVVATARAADLVLTGANFGYAGRPQLGLPYAVRWKPEEGLGAEELDIVRRARRREYSPSPPCSEVTSVCNTVDPIKPGPVISFTPASWDVGTGTGAVMPTGTSLFIDTAAAIEPTFRQPISGGAAPVAVLAVDQSVNPGQDDAGIHLYVSYSDDQVGLVQPGASTLVDRAIR